MGVRPRVAVILIPYVWLTLFFLVPFAIVAEISFAELRIAQPPYSPLFVCTDPAAAGMGPCFLEGHLKPDLYTQAYANVVAEPLYIKAYFNSIV
ncbi:MAG: putrescine ABC transporter permease PotH, partial [Dongia sp.]